MSPKPNLRITDFKHHHHHYLQDFYLLNLRLLSFLACLIGNGVGNLVILEKNERMMEFRKEGRLREYMQRKKRGFCDMKWKKFLAENLDNLKWKKFLANHST